MEAKNIAVVVAMDLAKDKETVNKHKETYIKKQQTVLCTFCLHTVTTDFSTVIIENCSEIIAY